MSVCIVSVTQILMDQVLKNNLPMGGGGTLTGKDWRNHSALLEAFEARSARLAVACAMRLSEASDSEAG